jgi:hypothetical protein
MVREFEKAYAEARRIAALSEKEMEAVADRIAEDLSSDLRLPEGAKVEFDMRPLLEPPED